MIKRVTAQGFNAPETIEELKAELIADASQLFNIDVVTNSADDISMTYLSNIVYNVYGDLGRVYFGNDISTAVGTQLDNLAKYKATSRIQSSQSVVEITMSIGTTTMERVVAIGAIKIETDEGVKFTNANEITITVAQSDTDVSELFVSDLQGASQNVEPNTITTITENPFSLLDSITNPLGAYNGTDIEEDEALRDRLLERYEHYSSSDRLEREILKIPSIQQVFVIDANTENPTIGLDATKSAIVVDDGRGESDLTPFVQAVLFNVLDSFGNVGVQWFSSSDSHAVTSTDQGITTEFPVFKKRTTNVYIKLVVTSPVATKPTDFNTEMIRLITLALDSYSVGELVNVGAVLDAVADYEGIGNLNSIGVEFYTANTFHVDDKVDFIQMNFDRVPVITASQFVVSYNGFI